MLSANAELLSDVTVWGKYARYLPREKRRETWPEIALRNAQMHIKKFPELEDEIWLHFRKVLNKEVVPSMRSAQFAGKPIELMPNRMYNCAYTAIDDYRAFSEIMYLLLGGSGVGYSVQKRHISKLPTIKPPRGEVRYMIQDDIVGWSDAVKHLMKAYFFGKSKPRFDYGDIRAKGAPLHTAGGVAPGPEPIRELLRKVEKVLESKEYGSKLNSVEVFDIICYIAEGVLSGGIRRSATICLFDHDNQAMLSAKAGDWWTKNPQRAMANISAVLDRRKLTQESFNRVFDITRFSGSGEPGFFLTNDPDLGLNPLIFLAA
jgi:ribonucleoside-diphosphate reductase alpha chain